MKFLIEHWGDIASVVGLALTIWFAAKARTAAEQARDAAELVRKQMSKLDSLSEISAAIALLSELKTLQRLRAWELLLDRYGSLRQRLVRIEQLNEGIPLEQSTQLASLLKQFRIMAGIESARASGNYADVDSAKFHRVVSRQIDELEGVMIAIKKAGI
jgi:hypothetical protein